MEEKLCPCCRCKRIPKIKSEPGDLWYVVCDCKKWNKYEALGSTKNGAIRHWNDLNRGIKRIGNPR